MPKSIVASELQGSTWSPDRQADRQARAPGSANGSGTDRRRNFSQRWPRCALDSGGRRGDGTPQKSIVQSPRNVQAA